MSNEARHNDIAALLARGIIRVKEQPLVAKAIESHMPNGQSYPSDPSPDTGSMQPTEGIHLEDPVQFGGDQ